jgi:hypothetical protein
MLDEEEEEDRRGKQCFHKLLSEKKNTLLDIVSQFIPTSRWL